MRPAGIGMQKVRPQASCRELIARRTISRMKGLGTASRPVRTAVLGYGLAGRVFHCPFIAAVPGLELTAIMQRTGQTAHNDYPEARILRSVDEVLADSTIDLIVIGTPNDTHFDFAKKALEAGKHVVIDKPFTSTSGEALVLMSLAARRGKVLAPFHNRRFDGDFLTVRNILENQTLGRIVEISSRMDRFRPNLRERSWKEQTGPGSGLLVDLGSHLLDQAMTLFGTPDSICARIYRDRDATAIDDGFELLLLYDARGVRYRCGASLVAADPAPRFLLHGTKGSYRKAGVDPQESTVGGGKRPPQLGSEISWLLEDPSFWGSLSLPKNGNTAELERVIYPTLPGDYRLFYENVRDAITGRTKLQIDAADGYRCVKLLELAAQSDAEARTLPVNLDFGSAFGSGVVQPL